MQIHVARPPAQLGVFSQEEVAAGLQDGRFLPSDQGWREGMSAWTPLSQWPEFVGLGIPSAPPESAQAASVQPMPAWERGSSISNYFGTIKDVALNPVQTFDALPQAGSMGRSLAFHYLTAVPFYVLVFILYAAFIATFGAREFGNLGGSGVFRDLGVAGVIGFLGAYFACLAIFVPLLFFVISGIVHLALLPWGPRGNYATTYRAMSYVNASFLPLLLIPLVGCFSIFWRPVVDVIALSRVHKLEWWKVLLSVLAFGCLCCGGYAVLFMMVTKGARGF